MTGGLIAKNREHIKAMAGAILNSVNSLNIIKVTIKPINM
jgi:hypothetical protein